LFEFGINRFHFIGIRKKIKHRIVFDFLGTVQFLYNFVEGSPIRHATLEKISKESCIKRKTLKSLSNTRWACRAEAVSAVQENFSMLVPAMMRYVKILKYPMSGQKD